MLRQCASRTLPPKLTGRPPNVAVSGTGAYTHRTCTPLGRQRRWWWSWYRREGTDPPLHSPYPYPPDYGGSQAWVNCECAAGEGGKYSVGSWVGGYGGEGRGVEVCEWGEKKCEFGQKKGMKHIDWVVGRQLSSAVNEWELSEDRLTLACKQTDEYPANTTFVYLTQNGTTYFGSY